ncbi:hypothetical protein PPERSA_06515 [Pseudocohnilembus persalinus]|uniref:Uncharacterized protein n=1 Tax=Pseudocohnilembus persalinus TaxID=266149 RepID=A0A0V0QRR0_PSEPJ|nr:hypothetical protein PPERSA_06515 [Pseudocohnilembus persalinus]|eukprot:KRX04881.1 hypothetical protein PPERSA_06515 [Pseudocohnilembus persalinus]
MKMKNDKKYQFNNISVRRPQVNGKLERRISRFGLQRDLNLGKNSGLKLNWGLFTQQQQINKNNQDNMEDYFYQYEDEILQNMYHKQNIFKFQQDFNNGSFNTDYLYNLFNNL